MLIMLTNFDFDCTLTESNIFSVIINLIRSHRFHPVDFCLEDCLALTAQSFNYCVDKGVRIFHSILIIGQERFFVRIQGRIGEHRMVVMAGPSRFRMGHNFTQHVVLVVVVSNPICIRTSKTLCERIVQIHWA